MNEPRGKEAEGSSPGESDHVAPVTSATTLETAQPRPPPAARKPASSPKMSYAELVKKFRIKEEDRDRFILSLSILRQTKPPKELRSTMKADLQHELRRVYVTGLPFIRVKELYKHLFNMRIRMSKVFNVAYLGRHTVEILVAADYQNNLERTLFTLGLTVDHEYDPTKTLDPKADEAIKAKVKASFLKRLCSTANRARRDPARKFFADWFIQEGGNPSDLQTNPDHLNPDLSAPTTTTTITTTIAAAPIPNQLEMTPTPGAQQDIDKRPQENPVTHE
ncbi:uncharacterized protein VTP21DRAFT_11346 [Calcarisporiella thermophila]|uniref:uncharacterized protein n=1 Tax=Calcarisporiella thermophila TaxID=911321 RepID=UPI0037439F36